MHTKTKAAKKKSDLRRRQVIIAAVKSLEKTEDKLELELKKLKKNGPARAMAMSVQDDDKPADVQIRIRGVEKQRGDNVPRGFLQVALTAPPYRGLARA